MLNAPSHITPPVADRRPHRFSHHGDTMTDDYAWLKDAGYPEVTDEGVLSYLREENAYYEAVSAPVQSVVDEIFEEIKGRIKDDESGVPWQDGLYDFYWAFAPGAQYRTWYYRPRQKSAFEDGEWTVLYCETKAAEGLEYFRLGSISVSPDGRYLAVSADTNGSERFTVTLTDLTTGEALSTCVEETSGELVWAADSQHFYTVKVSKEWRPYLVEQHGLSGERSRVFEETSTSFFVHVGASSSKDYLIIRSADHVTAECHLLSLTEPYEPFLAAARREKHDYYIDHAKAGHPVGQFVIRSNTDHENFGIYISASGDEESWTQVLAGSNTRYIHGMQAFDGWIAVEDRVDGLDQLTLVFAGGSEKQIPIDEPVYEVGLGGNHEAGQGFVRLAFSSLLTPPTVLDVPIENSDIGDAVVRKVQDIPSGYDRNQYRSERLMITARDGAQVPVSLVYRGDWEKGKGRPLHLYGYGAYGLGMSPSFSAARLSLLDRGFAYAIAHTRGGDELGQPWYEAGKLSCRTNTFNDFVDVAKGLVAQSYAVAGGITISGGSAGGELMGAVLNQAPDLFCGAALHVPFVDVLNTMLDANLPLTPIEWPEWGNPIEDADAYTTIKSYCPYSNIEAKAYPPMLVTGGLNDPRVTYWEPAKWTAKMRATKTDNNLLVMKINMGAGHGGKSGRFERYREVAEEYAFMLRCFEAR